MASQSLNHTTVLDKFDKRMFISVKRCFSDSVPVYIRSKIICVVVTDESAKRIAAEEIVERRCGVDVVALLRIEITFLGQEVSETERVSLRVTDQHTVFSIYLEDIE